jgi:hypothetical protein
MVDVIASDSLSTSRDDAGRSTWHLNMNPSTLKWYWDDKRDKNTVIVLIVENVTYRAVIPVVANAETEQIESSF